MPSEHDGALAVAFGRNLANARRRAGISQEALARSSGLNRDAIGKLERGHRVPRLDTMLMLAKALGVLPAELLAGLEP